MRSPHLSRAVVLLFAATGGSSAGSLYYLQPLLHEVSGDLHISTGLAGAAISSTQVGYLLGLALIVPLGDFVDRRKLIAGLLTLSLALLACCAAAPNFTILCLLVFGVGISAASAQVVVPWAASLAAPEERGSIVGQVMSGLLLGILGSRVISGFVAGAGGWRTMMVVAAFLQALMALGVWMIAPRQNPEQAARSYPQLLVSIGSLIREQSVLRHRMLLGGLSMAGFSCLWTAIAFLLAGSHGSSYHYNDTEIGLFGIAGIAGALASPLVGKLADRGYVRPAQYFVWGAQLISWVLMWLGGSHLFVLIVGLLIFDFGVQGVQLANQSAVYSLDPEARSRLTTAYQCAYFLGGVLGSLIGSNAYASAGWDGVCIAGGIIAIAGLSLWALFAFMERDHDLAGVAAHRAIRESA